MLQRLNVPALLAFALLTAAAARADVPLDPAEVRPVAVGTQLPTLALRTVGGEAFRLDPAALEAPLVLVFYRGGWCPYCNRHMGALQKIEPELVGLGYRLLFVSPDRPEKLYASLRDADLQDPATGLTILSDSTMAAARALGIAFRIDDPTLEKYRGFGIDLEEAAGAAHHELPVPAVFVVERSGRIAFVHANPDYTERLSPPDLLAAARRVAAER